MRLGDFEQVGRRRFTAPIADASRDEAYELILSGPDRLVREMFDDADIEITIDYSGKEDGWAAERDEMRDAERGTFTELTSLEETDDLLKPSPPDPERDRTVFVALHRTKGDGTPFFAIFRNFFVPGAASLIFTGSWVNNGGASLTPSSGDQDLFLHFYSRWTPPVAASARGGIFTDTVTFFMPTSPFRWQILPVFRIFGWSTGVCRIFTALGNA